MHVDSATTQPNALLIHPRSQARLAPPQVSGPTATTDTRAAHTADAPAKTKGTLMERLMRNWGRADARFDYDGSGKVGTGDLLKLLDRIAQRPQRHQVPAPMPQPDLPGRGMEARIDPADDAGQAKKRLSPLEKLLAAWGQTGTEFDLDGDGVVGAGDLLALLRQMGEGGGAPSPAHADLMDALGQLDPQSAPDASTLEKLLAAWGQSGTNYDYDSNGEVGTGDLLAMLQRMSGGVHEVPAPVDDYPLPGAELPLHSPTTRAMFEHLARSLMQQYDPSQPQALLDRVADSSLGDGSKSFLTSKLAAMMPRGTYVSTMA